MHFLSVFFVSLISCAALATGGQIQFDPELSDDLQSVVTADLSRLQSMEFNVSKDSWFQKIFKGNSGKALFQYLDERIQYLISWTPDLGGRVSGVPFFPPPAEMKDEKGNVIAALSAYNFGSDVWMQKMKYFADAPPVRFELKWYKQLAIPSMRVGLIELGPRFFERRDPKDATQKIKTSVLERMATLVHEARHSDCTGGLSDEDLSRLTSGRAILNTSCGHQHVECPVGHKYQGVPACENLKWGAFAIESIFLQAVAENCNNCTDQERAEAKDLLQDRTSRVLNWATLVNGKGGEPDMTSSGAPWEHSK